MVASTSSPHHVVEPEALAEVMTAREGRPLLLIDLAVPRDIHPDCRQVDGVSLHDMDDLQALVERNASGREAEARRAESVLRSELARFERWLASQDVTPTVASLRERATEIVDRVLAENEPRWESLTEADRERMQAMARAIASRLLHEPTLRLKRSSGEDDAYLYVNALRELFGLDAPTAPPQARDAEVRPLREARRASARPVERPSDRLKLATRGSRLALAQARLVAEALGGAEIIAVSSSDGEPGDKERFVRAVGTGGPGRRGGPGGPLGQGPARRASRRVEAGRGAWPRRSRRRLRGRGVVARPRCPRGRASAPPACAVAPSFWRCGRISSWWSCTATSTPACGSCPRASSTGSCSPPPACGVWDARRRSPSASGSRS